MLILVEDFCFFIDRADLRGEKSTKNDHNCQNEISNEYPIKIIKKHFCLKPQKILQVHFTIPLARGDPSLHYKFISFTAKNFTFLAYSYTIRLDLHKLQGRENFGIFENLFPGRAHNFTDPIASSSNWVKG